MARKYGPKNDANYNKLDQVQPKKRMGQMGFANLPSEPIMEGFGFAARYRDGIVNDYTSNIESLSNICENHRSDYGNDSR